MPAFRGRGYGKALLARLAQLAVERGCGRFEWSVLDWNEPAIGFYKKLGAKPMEEWKIFRVTGGAGRWRRDSSGSIAIRDSGFDHAEPVDAGKHPRSTARTQTSLVKRQLRLRVSAVLRDAMSVHRFTRIPNPVRSRRVQPPVR